MATKKELAKKAAALEIPGRSSMDKGQLEKAIAKAEGGTPKKASKAKAKSPEQLQEERLARSRANRDAAIKERNEGQAEAERLARKALAETPTGPQAAVLRAEEENDA